MATADATADLMAQFQVLEDSRQDLDVLLAEHEDSILRLRGMVEDVVKQDPVYFDEVALLRYVLSNKEDFDKAAAAIRNTFAWRRSKAHLLEIARSGGVPSMHAAVAQHAVAEMYIASSAAPLLVIRVGKSNPKRLVAAVSHDDLVDWLMFHRERAFIVCDRATRATRKLTKAITVVDLEGTSMFAYNGTFAGIVGETSKMSEQFYPQLLEKSVMVNLPTFISMIWKFARLFLTKRTLEKTTVCNGNIHSLELHRCPFASKRFLRADLPGYLGGSTSEGDTPNVVEATERILRAFHAEELEAARVKVESGLAFKVGAGAAAGSAAGAPAAGEGEGEGEGEEAPATA